ncbi:MAG TPA: TetR/AcrR family transcriptional regulator [Gammaproteobacteria bacterium]|nr:TetR/AcrR family transcriptional regulator [Gammaproteobacteria bacterium]
MLGQDRHSYSPDQIPLFNRPADEQNTLLRASRRRIMAAAKRRFAHFSYDGTTMAGIARAAGVPFPELLAQFHDKLSLLMAVFDEGWESINLRLADIVITSVSAKDAALSMAAVMTRVLERDEDLARLLLFEGRRLHPDSGELMVSRGYRRFMELCTEIAVRGQRDGSFTKACRPRVIASMLVGAIENLQQDRLIAEQAGMRSQHGKDMLVSAVEVLVSSLRPGSP